MVPTSVDLLDVLLVKEHLSLGRVVESLDESDNRRFSAARVTDKSNSLTVLDFDVDPLENGNVRLGWVAELDINKVNLTMICTFLSLSHLFCVEVTDLFRGLGD